MKIFSYILMTLSILTFSIISMEDPGNNTPVTLSGNKRKRNGHEQQPEFDFEDIESFASQLLKTMSSTELEALTEIPEGLYSTLCDAIDSQDHYQTPSSSTESEEAQVAVLGLLASDALAQKSQEKVTRSSKSHPTKKLYQCDYEGCNKAYKRSSHLKEHKEFVHKAKKPHKCDEPDCNKAFPSPYKLKRHKLIHSNEKSHKCNEPGCNKAFTRKEYLESHKLIHANKKPHKCDEPDCNKAFPSPYKLKRHKLIHSNEKSHKCDEPGCNKAFTLKKDLEKHKLIHTGEKPHKCDEPGCNKAFLQKGHLNRHKHLIHSLKSLLEAVPSIEHEPALPENDLSFFDLLKTQQSSQGNLYSTIDNDTSDTQNHYQAQSSSTVSEESQVAALGLLASDALAQKPQERITQSSRGHPPKKLYRCDEPGCNKILTSPYKLKEHTFIHTGKKPHKCDEPGCNKAFPSPYRLKKHELIHTKEINKKNEKSHKCDEPGCNKAFTLKGNLNNHKRLVHSLKLLLETVPPTEHEPTLPENNLPFFDLLEAQQASQKNLDSTIDDETSYAQDHYQAPSSSTESEDTQAVPLSLLLDSSSILSENN